MQKVYCVPAALDISFRTREPVHLLPAKSKQGKEGKSDEKWRIFTTSQTCDQDAARVYIYLNTDLMGKWKDVMWLRLMWLRFGEVRVLLRQKLAGCFEEKKELYTLLWKSLDAVLPQNKSMCYTVENSLLRRKLDKMVLWKLGRR